MRLSRNIAIAFSALALLASLLGGTAASAKTPPKGSSCSHPWRLKWTPDKGYGKFSDSRGRIRLITVLAQNQLVPDEWDIGLHWYGLKGARICKAVFRAIDGETFTTNESGRLSMLANGPYRALDAVITARAPRKK